jgi:hypothetical protein
LDGGEVNEYVLTTFLGDEAVALRGIEPLHGTSNTIRHCDLTPLLTNKGFFCDASRLADRRKMA